MESSRFRSQTGCRPGDRGTRGGLRIEPLEIGFNARYLLDIVSQLEGDTALVKLFDSGSPTLIQDREGAASLYVLMPMRV